MNAIWISMAAVLPGGIAACTTHAQDVAGYRAMCLTRDDVPDHAHRSRNGLSAPCNQALRARNAARPVPPTRTRDDRESVPT